MNKTEIGLNAEKVWGFLTNYSRWSYLDLKRKSGLRDNELGAALGWLAHEQRVEFDETDEDLYVYLCVNVYIG